MPLRPPPPALGPAQDPEELQAQARALPIYQHEQDIVRLVSDHPVVVVEGPTGSGKTTQIPRMLLRAGVGAPGLIGVTQPRRIAAVSVAWRIAAEEGVELGDRVGYAIRFDDRTGPETALKIMTDGILLQEARSDALFGNYGVLVVDEAHERSLNIDFTLGLLHRALARRDDLRVIVSSATLDPLVFQRYFEPVAGEVPLIHIAARTFPVEVLHRRPESDHPADVADAAAREILAIHRSGEPGAVLAFLTGEEMIKRTAESLYLDGAGRDLVVLPLYGRLTREEQERVFDTWPGRRKVVLATNIAETSITIPDVRFVVDSGLAKVPRVSARTGIQTLFEEGISQASADQRAGRAGRTAPGRAVRLYAAKDLAARPMFTDEEILRLDLSEVVLRLIDLGVSDVEAFPFPTEPPRGKIRAALERLEAMGAIDEARALTAIGERMVPFPLAPPLSRMVVEAADRFPDVVDDVLLVGAWLSGRAPFLFPAGEETEARHGHQALAQPMGDAATAVYAMRGWQRARDKEAYCQRHFLDPHLMAFIDKTHRQLVEIAQAHGIEVRGGGSPAALVQAVAAGFADRILRADGRTYEGPGDTAIAVHPSSTLFGARHKYVVACEIVISRRAYAREVSVLKPEWIPALNPGLARRWRIGGKPARRAEAMDPVAIPPTLQLGDVELPVLVIRGEPRLEIPAALAPRLAGADPAALPARALGWKTRITTKHYRFCQGMPLGLVLELLPLLPLPEDDERLEREVPEGVLLEVDRNLHLLGRYLDKVLAPSLPERGRTPGWAMLVANGGGGYWYEVTTSFPEALETSLAALEDLLATLPDGDPLEPPVTALLARVVEQLARAEAAMASHKARRR